MLSITDKIKKLIDDAYAVSIGREEDKKRKQRIKAIEYYNGDQKKYIFDYISFTDQVRNDKMPYSVSNITKKLINGTSLSYINRPQRYINGERNDNYEMWTETKDSRMLEVDRMAMLLDRSGVKIEWNAKKNRFKYRLLTDMKVEYDQYDDEVISVMFPIKSLEHKRESETVYEYWDMDSRWIVFGDGEPVPSQEIYGFQDNKNPYGLIPVVVCKTDGNIAEDLINANEVINCALTELNDLIKYRAFGVPWVAGFKGDIDQLVLNYNNALAMSDPQARAGMLETTVNLMQVVDAIKFQIQQISEIYGVNFNYGIDGNVSGFSLLVQNIELIDNIRVYNEIKRQWEADIFAVEQAVIEKDGNGVLKGEFTIDFAEYSLPVNKQEQIAWNEYRLRNKLVTPVDLIMEENPDLNEDEAQKKYDEALDATKRNTEASTPESESERLLKEVVNV